MNEHDLKHIIEATLLAAGKPITTQQIMDLFEERERPEPESFTTAIGMLIADYETRGIELVEVASGWRIQVRPKAAEVVSRLWTERPAKYSRAFLETMALIAYRQPITRSEIEEIRGVSISSTIMRTMQERGWIRTVGHREVPGRPELLGTTREFLDYFGLKSLDQLPTLAELKDLDTIGVQLELPADQPQTEASAEGDGAEGTDEGAETEAAGASGEAAESSGEIEASAAAGSADANAADADAAVAGSDADANVDNADADVSEAEAETETVAAADAADDDSDDDDADDADDFDDDDEDDEDEDDEDEDDEDEDDSDDDDADNDDDDDADSNEDGDDESDDDESSEDDASEDDNEMLADADDEDSAPSSPMVASSGDDDPARVSINEPSSEG